MQEILKLADLFILVFSEFGFSSLEKHKQTSNVKVQIFSFPVLHPPSPWLEDPSEQPRLQPAEREIQPCSAHARNVTAGSDVVRLRRSASQMKSLDLLQGSTRSN